MNNTTENKFFYGSREIFTGFIDIVKDKAVVYGISNRIWLFISSAVTAPLIIIFFTPALQGYYYTFNSLLGIQTLFVMGFGQLIQQFVSHEWSKINFDPSTGLSGDKIAIERLSSIKQYTVRWFSWIAFLMFLGLSIGGYFFMLNSSSDSGIYLSDWLLPWLTISLLKSFQILLSPGLTFLEGINEVQNVNRFRFTQSLSERISSWLVMIIGGKLWLFSAGTAVNIYGQINFFRKKYYNILKSVLSLKSSGNKIWKKEILPLQWRFAVSSVSGYLNFSFIIPLVFWYLGPVTAGRAGISWAVITMFWGLSVTIITTKVPSLTIDAANKNYKRLNKTFFISTFNSTLLLLISTLSLLPALILLKNIYPSIAGRFLDPLPMLLLSLSIIPHHFRFAMVSYMRAFKKEPFWKISVLESALVLVVLPLCCKYWGITGLGAGFLSIIVLITVVTYAAFRKIKYETPI